jgi:hypothetical protein
MWGSRKAAVEVFGSSVGVVIVERKDAQIKRFTPYKKNAARVHPEVILDD